MADKIRITPSELRAQAVELSALSKRMDGVLAKTRSISSSVESAVRGTAGLNSSVKMNSVVSAIAKSGEVLQIGANLAQESAEKFTNTDATIRSHVNGKMDNATDAFFNRNIPQSVLKKPVSTQKVTTPRMEKWENLQNTDGFKPGTEWGWNNTYVEWYKGNYVGGSQCYAMAAMMQIEMEGSGFHHDIYTSNGGDIQPGDMVHYWHNDSGHGTEEHWIYVYDVRDGVIYYGEGNVDVGGYQGVRYKSEPVSNFSSGRWQMDNIRRV